ncbi:MAG: hypothetical protein ABR961_07570 [Thermoanaerobaculaceae bacterium]|jgi:4-amino-4-deoxy-L-arabinose transferase-like glycosyltransferase
MSLAGPSDETVGTGGLNEVLESQAGLRVLAALALAAVLLHFVALESAPPGLYVDEASYGYNAYSILRTGSDEAGVRLPLFFRSFGEYKNPVLAYSLVPLVGAFGPSILAIRIGSALFALASALFVALVVQEATSRRGLARLAFLLTALLPWLFTPSRVAMEPVVLPCMIALAWWAWLVALRTRRVLPFMVSWSAWTLAFYSYSAGRLVAPLLAIVLVVVSWRDLRGARTRCVLASWPFVLGLGVALRWMAAHPGALTARLHIVAGWQEDAGLASQVLEVITRYLAYFSPRFLLTHGDPIVRHHTGFGGELFLFMAPLVIVGAVVAIRKRSAFSKFALAGFLAFPMAGSITDSAGHATRTIGAVPFVTVLAIVGTAAVIEFLSDRPRIVLAGFAVAALEVSAFLFDFFAFYPERASTWFNRGLTEAVQTARAAQHADLYFAPGAFRDENGFVNQPYILLAYLGGLDPALFQRGGLAAFHIYPLDGTVQPPPGSVLLVKDSDELFAASGRPVLVQSQLHIPPGARTVAEFASHPGRTPPGPMFRVIAVP